MTFVTDEIVRVATLAACRAETAEMNRLATEKGRPGVLMRACDKSCGGCEWLYRAALSAAAPLIYREAAAHLEARAAGEERMGEHATAVALRVGRDALLARARQLEDVGR